MEASRQLCVEKAIRSCGLSFQQLFCLSGNNQFLVRRDDPDLSFGSIPRGSAPSSRVAPFFWSSSTIPSSSSPWHNFGTELGPVLADASGEHDHVGTAEFHKVGPEVLPDGSGEHVQGQLSPFVTLLGRFAYIADIAADAAQAEQATLCRPGRREPLPTTCRSAS